jgi:hypothetical protein
MLASKLHHEHFINFMGIFYFKNLKELRKYLIWEETNTKKRMPRCVYLKFSSLGFISLIILDGLGLVRKKEH